MYAYTLNLGIFEGQRSCLSSIFSLQKGRSKLGYQLCALSLAFNSVWQWGSFTAEFYTRVQ